MFSKILKQIIQHKFLTTIILLALIAGGYYGYQWLFGNKSTTQYVAAAVEKGTIISSISGTGQVSASNQVDIKPKVSGDVVYAGIENSQEVKAGALLAQIDPADAQKSVRDAETALETAKLELEELLQPADAYSLMQAENALIQAKDNLTKLKFTRDSDYQKALDAKQEAEDDFKKAYEDGFNTVTNAFLDLPDIMAGLQDMLFSSTLVNYQWNIDYYANAVRSYDDKADTYRNNTNTTHQAARQAYDQNFADYKTSSRFSDNAAIEKLVDQTYDTTKVIAEAIKNANDFIQFYQDKLTERNLKPQTLSTTHLSNLKTYTGKTNTHLLNLLAIKRTIQDSEEAKLDTEQDLIEMDQNNPLDLAAAERTVKEREEALAKLKAAPDELDVRAKKIAIQQKEDALLDAQQNLADCYIRAPFNGVVAEMNSKKGDSVSAATVIATLITKQKIAEISLNEVDVAKVKAGQKATLTFDAIEGLNITGEVAGIDAIGTVTQGVVNYNAKIIFDTQDERVKIGMSISAAVITDMKQNVLIVSNSAIKSSGNEQYVEVLVNNAPQTRSVETGLSNDTMSEIISGLEEGEKVVTQTITGNTSTQTGTQNSGLRIPGMGGFR